MPSPRRWPPLLALVLLLCGPLPPAQAQWPQFSEMGLKLYSHTDLDIKGGNLGGLGIAAQTTAPLLAHDDLRLDLRIELSVGGFWNYADGAELSLAPCLRLYFPPPLPHRFSPFIEGGFGLFLADVRIPELGTQVNFLSFGGLGLRHGIGPRTFLDLGYRLRHLSNGGMDEQNHGVTSHLIALEVAWLF